jgi:hypothetical protein
MTVAHEIVLTASVSEMDIRVAACCRSEEKTLKYV